MPFKGSGPRHGGAAKQATAAAEDAARLSMGGEAKETRVIEQIALRRIQPDPGQPRTYFNPEKLRELADSLAHEGQLQPISVRPIPPTGTNKEIVFEILEGERRWRACGLNGFEFIDAIVITNVKDQQKIRERQVAENIQRENLTLADICQEITRFHVEFKQGYKYIANGPFAPLAKGNEDWVADRFRTWNKAQKELRDLMFLRNDIISHAGVIVSAPEAIQRKLTQELAKGATVRQLNGIIEDYKDHLERRERKEREEREKEEARQESQKALVGGSNGITIGHNNADYTPQASGGQTAPVAPTEEAANDEEEFSPDSALNLLDSFYNVFSDHFEEWRKHSMTKGTKMALKAKIERQIRLLQAEANRL